ncbi:MAG: hypothetical protein Q8L60_08070 [Gammaproteobacteria bacterium]|nr:hypothetical protein [Gammaproteobacteria bacterium]MDP2140077.1 hypothetical protein [Gammaproteobacteria bacterium]MDP2347639.1 hypothetical protein [Gammaproteobacteria bacterium]
MQLPVAADQCLKCDAVLHLQTDGSLLQVDIAHNHETIKVALEKLAGVLAEARSGHTRAVRLVVGRGLIREEVLLQLSWLQRSGEILSFNYESGNTGAILITIRR